MPDAASQRHTQDLVLSYHRVRTALGMLGLFLPLTLILGGLQTTGQIEPSISDFFHTKMRDVYVGTLSAIGIFLISYRGYRRRDDEVLSDNVLATLAGLAAFGLAFFPNAPGTNGAETVSQVVLGEKVAMGVHFVSGSLFFFCLALFCYLQFPKTANPTRRRIYLACGHVIILSLIGLIVGSYFKMNGSEALQRFVVDWRVVFWAEAVGVWAFSLSWLVKGKADLALARRRRAAGQV